MASARSRARAAGAALPAEPQNVNELESPDRQLEVLTPTALTYNLRFTREAVIDRLIDGKRVREPYTEIVERPIEIPTELTLGQVISRRVLDNLNAFVTVVIAEFQRIAPGDSRVASDRFLAAAMMMGSPRAMLRELIASVATYTDADGERIIRPSVQEIEDGMDDGDLSAAGLMFFNRAIERRTAQKKAIAGA